MPEFQKDAYGPQDFHDDQLAHYGFKRNTVNDEAAEAAPRQPLQGFQMNEATGMPVPSKSSVPKRKPVAPTNLPVAPRKASPVRPPRPDSPNAAMNKIYRGQDGKFDVSTVGRASSNQPAGTPPATPSSPLSRPFTPSSRPTPQRTDSNASNASWRSRRDSVEQLARRLSNSFREKVDIIKMNRNERAGYVKKRSNSTASQNGKFARDSFDSIQRDSLLDFQISSTAKPMPGNLSRSDKLALNVSKAMDPIKRGRSGTNDSNMSFGMTDMAPPGAMHMCKRCARATDTFLKDELCAECYEETKKGRSDLFTDPFQFPQGRSTWPETNTLEHGYMKLPNRRIVRLRQTIYEDPGNPFADELEAENNEEPTALEQKSLPLPPSGQEMFYCTKAASFENSWTVPSMGHRPSLGERNLPARIQLHRRSKSAAGTISSPVDSPGDYVAPRSLWRRDTLPMNHAQDDASALKLDVRDTKFYGFYDDVLRDYSSKKRDP